MSNRTEISTLGEFGLIRHLTDKIELKNPSTLKGVGDDAAVLDYTDKQVLVTTDLLLEGIHFDLMYVPLKHLGYKSAVVNFSDIYAMNGRPKQITVSLGISKRTLYEVFSDKETLLEECILKGQKEGDEFLRNVLATSENVLEVLLKCYQRSIEQFHATNKKFFEDIKKYPKAYELMTSRHNQDSEETVNFFKEGVKQGIFRDDVNFAIINLLVREQIDVLMNTDICKEYSFLEVYESIMFTFLRGISTEKGAHELEVFIREYRKKTITGNNETEND